MNASCVYGEVQALPDRQTSQLGNGESNDMECRGGTRSGFDSFSKMTFSSHATTFQGQQGKKSPHF